MMFKTDVWTLKPNSNRTIMMEGSILPNSPSVFFRAKQEELFRQYETARLFLTETGREDSAWDYWFCRNEEEQLQEIFTLLFREKMFEASLMFYNIIVDLSWVLCYVSAEYAFYDQDKVTSFDKLMSIEEANSLLRKTEEITEGPDARGNPFSYLKKMTPQFSPAVDLIIDFWKSYKESPTRMLYNFIKHRGKPLYKEIEEKKGSRLLGLSIAGIKCPTDVRDVQKALSLDESIKDLIEFDDNNLFPFVSNLIMTLEKAVDPSPYVM